MSALVNAFDSEGELLAMGGRVTNFDVHDEQMRSQHYDWYLPIYFR